MPRQTPIKEDRSSELFSQSSSVYKLLKTSKNIL